MDLALMHIHSEMDINIEQICDIYMSLDYLCLRLQAYRQANNREGKEAVK